MQINAIHFCITCVEAVLVIIFSTTAVRFKSFDAPSRCNAIAFVNHGIILMYALPKSKKFRFTSLSACKRSRDKLGNNVTQLI